MVHVEIKQEQVFLAGRRAVNNHTFPTEWWGSSRGAMEVQDPETWRGKMTNLSLYNVIALLLFVKVTHVHLEN